MKVAIGIIVGIFLGVVTNLISNFLAPHAERKRKLIWSIFIGVSALAVILALLPESINPPNARSVTVNKAKGAVLLKTGQALIAANKNGVAVIRFIFNGDYASYQWRYWNRNNQTTTTGTGRLFEKYAETPTASGFTVVDIGSELYATIVDMKIMWSSRSTGKGLDLGWVYFNDDSKDLEISFAVLSEEDFDTVDLSSVRYGD